MPGAAKLEKPAPLRMFIVAGEASGDELGASLVEALRARGIAVEIAGIGGPALEATGLKTLFPQSDIAVMGLGPVIARLPLILRRIRESAAAALVFTPDILLTIDSPDFSKRVARKVRAKNPVQRSVHWVCPSVWAWRPGRAKAMRPLYDRVLCLLPFEPAELEKLNGPPGIFTGHPLVERLGEMRPQGPEEMARRAAVDAPAILLLPGSRLSEISRLMALFLASLDAAGPALSGADITIPTLPHLVPAITAALGSNPRRIRLLLGREAKYAAFRNARAALAASGTVTLELALAGIPMVAAYRVANWEAAIARRLIRVSTANLPNLILDEHFVPEFIQQAATAETLGASLAAITRDGPERARQVAAFVRLEAAMREGDASPSQRAAEAIISFANS